jgi:hypothetical protein
MDPGEEEDEDMDYDGVWNHEGGAFSDEDFDDEFDEF